MPFLLVALLVLILFGSTKMESQEPLIRIVVGILFFVVFSAFFRLTTHVLNIVFPDKRTVDFFHQGGFSGRVFALEDLCEEESGLKGALLVLRELAVVSPKRLKSPGFELKRLN